jgi:crotonobetainyl-CoA:carnitine CoA-transferase CaiB-like acyl-CoA transferase
LGGFASAEPAPCSGSRSSQPKFTGNDDRVVHGKEIMAIFAGLFLNQVPFTLEDLEKAGVSRGPINDFAQVFGGRHVRERGMRSRWSIPSNPRCR